MIHFPPTGNDDFLQPLLAEIPESDREGWEQGDGGGVAVLEEWEGGSGDWGGV